MKDSCCSPHYTGKPAILLFEIWMVKTDAFTSSSAEENVTNSK